MAEPGTNVMRRLSEEFPFLGFLLALFAFGNLLHYFLIPSYLAVTRENWIVREILRLFVRNAWNRQWIHALHQYLALLDEFCTFSTVEWTRILRCSVSVLTQNGEGCSADASAFSPGMRCSHLEIRKLLL